MSSFWHFSVQNRFELASFSVCISRYPVLIIGLVAGYKYDVFISYSRVGSAQKWLMNHFYPKLKDCLADQMAPVPTVYVDKKMPRAVEWPAELRKALHESKILLAVLTPPYFESKWCQAELDSMLEREAMLGLGNIDQPQGLIYPILYSDSDNFPEAKVSRLHRSWWDFKALATPEPVFQQSRDWHDFHRMVTDLATDLVRLLKQVPEWRADYPLIDQPEPVLIPPPSIPRFDR